MAGHCHDAVSTVCVMINHRIDTCSSICQPYYFLDDEEEEEEEETATADCAPVSR